MVIENLSGNFHLRTEITKVNRGVPLTLTNPWYKDILAKYDQLRGVEIDDVDLKRELPSEQANAQKSRRKPYAKWGNLENRLLNLRALDGPLCLMRANHT